MVTTDIPVATYGDPDVTMDGEMLTQELHRCMQTP